MYCLDKVVEVFPISTKHGAKNIKKMLNHLWFNLQDVNKSIRPIEANLRRNFKTIQDANHLNYGLMTQFRVSKYLLILILIT